MGLVLGVVDEADGRLALFLQLDLESATSGETQLGGPLLFTRRGFELLPTPLPLLWLPHE
jgi:hypothetical protein